MAQQNVIRIERGFRRDEDTGPKGHGATVESLKDLPGFTRTLHRGEHLLLAGDRGDAIYLIRGGVLKSYLISAEGDEQVLGFHLAGDAVGLDGVTGDAVTRNVVALDTTFVTRISVDEVLRQSRTSLSLQRAMLQAMAQEIQRLTGMLQLERRTAEQRLACFLLDHSRYQKSRGCSPVEFDLPMSRRDLARYLDLATETVSRLFSRMQRQGLVSAARSQIRLQDMGALQAMAETEAA